MTSTAAVRHARSALDLLRDRGDFLDGVEDTGQVRAVIGRSLLTAVLGAGFFGLALGGYAQSLPQMLASAIKVPLLLLGTAVLCFPTFHAFQVWRGPRPLSLMESVALQTTALASVALIWASMSAPIIFLVSSTRHYQLAQILALVVGAIGGVVGLARLLSSYRARCGLEPEEKPRFLIVYFVVFAAVGGQLAWSLRPFVGSPTLPFQLFRPYNPAEGNFFAFLVGLLGG